MGLDAAINNSNRRHFEADLKLGSAIKRFLHP